MKLILTILSILAITSTSHAKSFRCVGDRDFEEVKKTINLELGEADVYEGREKEILLGDVRDPNTLQIEAEVHELAFQEVLTISVTRPQQDGSLDIKRATGSTKGIVQFKDETAGGSTISCLPTR